MDLNPCYQSRKKACMKSAKRYEINSVELYVISRMMTFSYGDYIHCYAMITYQAFRLE